MSGCQGDRLTGCQGDRVTGKQLCCRLYSDVLKTCAGATHYSCTTSHALACVALLTPFISLTRSSASLSICWYGNQRRTFQHHCTNVCYMAGVKHILQQALMGGLCCFCSRSSNTSIANVFQGCLGYRIVEFFLCDIHEQLCCPFWPWRG